MTRIPEVMQEGSAGSQPLRAAAVHGVRWTLITRGAIELMLVVSMIALARLVPPAEYGRYAIAAIVSELSLFIPTEGIGSALVQRRDLTREHLEAGSFLAIATSVVLTALTLLAASTIITPLFDARTSEIVRLAAPGVLIAGLGTVPMATLRRSFAFRRLGLINAASTFVRVVASIVLAVVGLGAAALVLGGLVAGLVGTALLWASASPHLPRPHRRATRDIAGYGLPAAAAAVSWVGFRNCDYAIVGARLGAGPAGYYFRAYTLGVEYQKKISLVMSQVGFPVLARTTSRRELADVQTRMVRVLTCVLFPLLVLLAVLAPVAVPWIFGPAWSPAVLPTQILVVGGASTLVIDAAGAAIMAQGRANAIFGYGVAHFAVYALVVFAVAPLGLAAVATGAAVVHGLFLVVAYALMLRDDDERTLPRLWLDLKPAVCCCLPLAAVAVSVNAGASAAAAPTVLHIAIVGLAGAAGYCLSLRALFPQTWRALQNLVRQLLPARPLAALSPRPAPAAGPGGAP